jgi:RHS repeat-associated protein
VHHAGGATTVTLDQRYNPGQWVPLGAFELVPGQGHRVVLSDEGAAGTLVLGDAVIFVAETARRGAVADAVKFVRPETPAFPASAATLTREFVTLAGRPLALVEGGPGGELLWVHTDHLGTPQKMTDSGGAVVWDAVFTPFGAAVSLAGTAENPQRFPGQRYDAETALHYNYFRDYDPSLGRYMESDPIGLLGGLNTYAYVGGNPTGARDPYGLMTLCLPGDKGIHCQDFMGPEMGGGGAGGGGSTGGGNRGGGSSRSSSGASKTVKDSCNQCGKNNDLVFLNRKGDFYPNIPDLRSGRQIPFPTGSLKPIAPDKRVPWGPKERAQFIKEWCERNYPTPRGGWKEYDIHHIRPREFGGGNDFWNLTPVPRGSHQTFNQYWRGY